MVKNGFLRSIIHLCLRIQKTLTFVTSLLCAFWCRWWKSWRSPCKQTHHWSWLCCDSCFTSSSYVLFDVTSRHSTELKWLMLHKRRKWFHSWRVKFPLVSMSASWFLVSMYLIWIFGVQIDSIEHPIKRNSVGLGKMSHCGTPPLITIILTIASFSSFTYHRASWFEDWTVEGKNQQYPNHWSLFEIAYVCKQCKVKTKFHLCFQRVFPFCHGFESCFEELKRADPINQEQEYSLTSMLHWKKWFLILLNCAKLKFVSTHTTYRHKCVTSNDAQFPPEMDFESSGYPAKSVCLPTHNMVPHISRHDLPCPQTMKKCADFPSMVFFSINVVEILNLKMVL